MHRDSVERNADMQALEVGIAGQAHGRAVAQHAGVAEFAADLGEELQRADGAVDIDRRIGLGVAGILRAISNQSSRRAANASATLPSNSARWP